MGQQPDNGLENDPGVHEQGHIPGVNDVVAQSPVERDSVPSVYLGHAGQSGPDGTARHAAAAGKNIQLIRNPWPGAYNGHVSLDNVDQLRQFIQGIAA